MLSGPLGGSLFNGKLFTRTQTWTSTLNSQRTKRQRNLFLRTILKSLVLLPWLIPHLRRPFLLVTSELLCLCLFDVGFIYVFFLSGLGPGTYVALLISIHSFFFIVRILIVVSSLFSMIYMARIEDPSETNKLVKLSRCGLVD